MSPPNQLSTPCSDEDPVSDEDLVSNASDEMESGGSELG